MSGLFSLYKQAGCGCSNRLILKNFSLQTRNRLRQHSTISSTSAVLHVHSHPKASMWKSPPHEEPGPRTQTQKPTSWCGAVGRSDKSIWGKLSVRNFRSNCLGQNWLLGRANPAAWGWGTMGANVLMCGRWLGRDNGRISQSSGWLIWDGSSQPLTVGSPIVLLLIPTSHKLQTKVNLFLKEGGGGISNCVSDGESDSKIRICERWPTL